MDKDYSDGIKRDLAEVKFLIHDLRIEKFINDVIHFHVTLNTDLEIYDIELVAQLHSDDVSELKSQAKILRKAYQVYSNAVQSFSPAHAILDAANAYVDTIQATCKLIIDPLWGRFDKVISFLPKDSRSVKGARHYRNDLRWVCGVYYRIEHFLAERTGATTYTEFDLGADVEDFTNNVIRGYVTEKSSSRVDIYFGDTDQAVIGGNRHRVRRMLFNLVMNAVDAMSNQPVGTLRIGVEARGDRAILSVSDDGSGMSQDKQAQLLSDKQTLDGELHSLGFVFVRQTVADLGGELKIDSRPGVGTTMSVILPFMVGKVVPPTRPSKCAKFKLFLEEEGEPPVSHAPPERPAAETPDEGRVGEILLRDHATSDARVRGCLFAIALEDNGAIDFFAHRSYEQAQDLAHEDLAPMFYQATVRGRFEDNEHGEPELILKNPQVVREYFEFKNLAEREYSADKYNSMVRDEYIRIARLLIETGLPPRTIVHATALRQLFTDYDTCFRTEPFPLEVLAAQPLTTT